MTMQPDATTPGLWVNTEWEPGTPGTFAVIIGVSRYTYLLGDATTYNLGQLYVSATTAYRFFSWLCDGYLDIASPLAMCWLLLSPTNAESAAESGLIEHALEPTFQNCSRALRFWFSEMELLPKSAAEKSKCFFFFSGHGLEVHEYQQILLPSDYLEPPAPQLNQALSTMNLYHGLAKLSVPHQIFFVDACRNDFPLLRAATIEGVRILNEWQNYLRNADRNAPFIYASVPGTQAFQPLNPSEGISLFGQALLEGLQAPRGLELDCDEFDPCAIRVNALLSFMQPRVMQLLRDRKARVRQRIQRGGSSLEDVPVTQVVVGESSSRGFLFGGTRTAPPPRADLAVTDVQVELIKTLETAKGWQPVLAEMHAGFVHDRFGSERVAEILHGARVYNLSRHKWVVESGVKAYALHRIEHDANTQLYQFVLSIPGNWQDHYWLELRDERQQYACMLPGDSEHLPRYLLEINFDFGHHDQSGQPIGFGNRWISSLSVRLAGDNQGPLHLVADLWEQFSELNLARAVQELDVSLAERLLLEKLESPLAATIAGIMLLRLNRTDLLHDWLGNLAHWFPDRPDGAILWAEHLLREEQIPTPPVNHVLMLLTRGLPHTAEALGYADQQVKQLLATATSQHDANKTNLVQLQERLRAAIQRFRPGGLFSVFSTDDAGTLTPQLVEGKLSGLP